VDGQVRPHVQDLRAPAGLKACTTQNRKSLWPTG